jgi:hypothetical protein
VGRVPGFLREPRDLDRLADGLDLVRQAAASTLFAGLRAVPQSIQSRAQFGFYGSAFLFPCVLLINVGFIAAQFVTQAEAMQGVAPSVNIPQWILILTVPALVIGIFGYRWIHRVMQATAVVVGLSLVIMLVQGLRFGSLIRRGRPGRGSHRPSEPASSPLGFLGSPPIRAAVRSCTLPGSGPDTHKISPSGAEVTCRFTALACRHSRITTGALDDRSRRARCPCHRRPARRQSRDRRL